MIRKNLQKKIEQFLSSFCMLKKYLSCLCLKLSFKSLKTSFYCVNYFHYFATKNKRESNKNVCENKDFRNIVTPFEDT